MASQQEIVVQKAVTQQRAVNITGGPSRKKRAQDDHPTFSA
jgi:hypothetical protein